MVSAKAEKAIELVAKIEATRTELAQLESELESLFGRPGKLKRVEVEQADGKTTKVPRNRLKALRILRNAGGPMTCKQVQKKLGLSNSGTMYVIRQLMEAGEVVSPSFGEYVVKKSN